MLAREKDSGILLSWSSQLQYNVEYYQEMRDTDHCTDQSTLFLRFKLNCQIVKTLKGTEYVNRRFHSHSYSGFSIFQMV